MNWRDPSKELPKEGAIVWILIQHWKKEGALSCEIYCGEVNYSKDKLECSVFNNDYIGSGGLRWILWQHEELDYRNSLSDMADAWLPESEITLPDWG